MPKNNSRATILDLDEAVQLHGRFITYPTAALLLSTSARTLKRLTARGELPCYRIGRTGAMRVKTEDVLNLIQQVA
ncbi:MAG TPA: helix-turn-helix domain-containing protein [Flavobacteriales bacterium]|jgi:excisionase family DNA binding protein|nr:helix-turn-helix domain-containing protein [Flavobacteriales bacterium]